MLLQTYKVCTNALAKVCLIACLVHGVHGASTIAIHSNSLILHNINGTLIRYNLRVTGHLEGAHENSLQIATEEKHLPPGSSPCLFLHLKSPVGQGAWLASRLWPRALRGLCPPPLGRQRPYQHADLLPIEVFAEQSQCVFLFWNVEVFPNFEWYKCIH